MSAFSPFASTHIPTVRIRFRLAVLWPAFAAVHAMRICAASCPGSSRGRIVVVVVILALAPSPCCFSCYTLFIASTRPTRVVLQKKTNPLVVLYQRRSLSLPAFSFLSLLVSCFASPRYMAFFLPTFRCSSRSTDAAPSLLTYLPPRLEPRMQNVA